ncbi:uncharacterized protein F4817DRAFT_324468 [Daldinia loculata]|uniref:uncharacterized protein n=1 Tax=Daldinia loculata TaxID=103429 RepID=UPI0020C537D0|nr:uncharacterized protein F4817DRAFT_324468 [Daldinia loculata]KAI1651416.1 hypothetical protein F4817DRAFT_324468 [Daldinia loculata]
MPSNLNQQGYDTMAVPEDARRDQSTTTTLDHNIHSSVSSLTWHPANVPSVMPVICTEPLPLQLLGVGAHLNESLPFTGDEHHSHPQQEPLAHNISCQTRLAKSLTATGDSNHSGIDSNCESGDHVVNDIIMDRLSFESAAPCSSSIGSRSESHEALATVSAVSSSSGAIIHQSHHHLSDTNNESASPTFKWAITPLPRAISYFWSYLYSISDIRAIVRFVVVIFSHLMGIWTALSVSITPGRLDDALPSLNDDSYPIMVAQVAASMLSPLLFTVVSTKEDTATLRQKLTSFYYVLLVVGVLMSLVSLLLYSLWPSGYRVTNITIIASLMFGVLGSWQFLEKSWKKTLSTNEDIELGLRQA